MTGMRNALKRLLKTEASPPEGDGHAREKDAGSANSSAIGATEDTLSRRAVPSGGRGFGLRQSAKALGAIIAVVALCAPLMFLPVEDTQPAALGYAGVTITVPPTVVVATTIPGLETSTTTTTIVEPTVEIPPLEVVTTTTSRAQFASPLPLSPKPARSGSSFFPTATKTSATPSAQ